MKKYDNYKDSDVEWIGMIPSHWIMQRIDWVSKIVRGNTAFKKDELLDAGEYIALQYGKTYKVDVVDDSFNFYVNSEFFNESQVTTKGDTILISTSETIEDLGHTCFYNNQNVGLLGGEQILLKPNRKFLHEKYLYHYSRQFGSELRRYARGLKVFRFNTSDLKQLFIAIPTLEEQISIGNYLDNKTSQIDHLISKKEKFIKLLEEERVAVINQAVTKGLDPNVPMKDSGVEWLGEIPEHWEVKRLRNLTESIKTGSTPPSEEVQYFEPNEINWYGPSDFENLILGDSKRKISKLAIDENKCKLFPANSILLIGIGATVGKVGLALEDCSSNQQLNAIILKNEYNPIYYLYFLSTIKDIIVMEASSATLPIFNQTQTKNIITTVPPANEQFEISNYIRNQEIRIESIITKSQNEIELLKEYKTALISEVVTGKVDVRNEILN